MTGAEVAPGATEAPGATAGGSKPLIAEAMTTVAPGGTAIENDPSAAGDSEPTATPPCWMTIVIAASWPAVNGVPEETTVPTRMPYRT